MTRQGEFDWIANYLAPLSGEDSFGLRDDAALLTIPENCELVVTQDAILEGMHFLPTDPPGRIAQKALRVNVSDIVSKGAKPFAYSVALGVPDRWADQDMAGFAHGLELDQKLYGLTLNGGDTYRSPERLCVSITMFGAVPTGQYKSRLGARVGDLLVVSCTIGDGAIGLRVAQGRLKTKGETRESLLDAYQLPVPPISLASAIANHATASMDISDGLLGDCRKLCLASKVSAELIRTKIPLSAAVVDALSSDAELWRTVLTGGDDYQCLCTIPVDRWDAFKREAKKAGSAVTRIGHIVSGEPGKVKLDMEGLAVSIGDDSYSHF